jgi:hypothetical protein
LVPRRSDCFSADDDDDDSAYEDDEPTFHRSPVSLENGYRPVRAATAYIELRFVEDSSGSEDDENVDGGGVVGVADASAERLLLGPEVVREPLPRGQTSLPAAACWFAHVIAAAFVVIVFFVSLLLALHHLR